MLRFVETALDDVPRIRRDLDVEALLGRLAISLGYRSAYLLEFPSDTSKPVRLWDSNEQRAKWWHSFTKGGYESVSRSIAETIAERGILHTEVSLDEARYAFAKTYDFVEATFIPITFDGQTRGIASFCGERPADLDDVVESLKLVVYALFVHARTLVPDSAPEGPIYLTPREREVMALLARGYTSDHAAEALGLSPRTVVQHVDNVSVKLGTSNRVHTVAEAIRRGML